MVGVYKITNLKTGDFYIGASRNTYKRKYNHRYPGIHSKKFEGDIQKYGWDNFLFEVIEECAVEDLLEREAYYISALRPAYNSIVRGRRLSDETRAKIGRMLTGAKQSSETKAKRAATMRKLRETKPQTNAGHMKKVGADLGPLGGNLSEFESVKSAAAYFGVHPSTVTSALKRNGKVKGVVVWYVV